MLQSQFRSVSHVADFRYAEAHKGAALVFGANTADAGGVMRAGSLCRSLMQKGVAIRAELPASRVKFEQSLELSVSASDSFCN